MTATFAPALLLVGRCAAGFGVVLSVAVALQAGSPRPLVGALAPMALLALGELGYRRRATRGAT